MLTFEQTIEGLAVSYIDTQDPYPAGGVKVCKLLAHNCSLMPAKSQVTFTAANCNTEQFSARQSTQRSHEDIFKYKMSLKQF